MGSVSDEDGSDQQSERCGSYSLSADVSESESSGDFCARQYAGDPGPSGSLLSSPVSAAVGHNAAPTFSLAAGPMTSGISEGRLLVWEGKTEKTEVDLSEVEMMKERFAKLLLGEDMSGGGKGVCTALAISNAITNLSATVFGELWRLEPLAPQKKTMWQREMGWLLSVCDYIVELIPSFQEFPGGGTFEVMVPCPRSDLYMNLPALKKLDTMLLSILDGFCDKDFSYVDREILVADANDGKNTAYPLSSFERLSPRQEEKWWLPCPRVPPTGLSEDSRKRLQQCRDCANQILKAAMAINSGVLAEMEIPDVYLETLPKTGKSCLGEIIYRYITAEQFSPECLLDCLDLSSEHHAVEIANRIETAIHVWGQKDWKRHHAHNGKAKKSWSGKIKGLVSDTEKNQCLAERAEGLLQRLRLRHPALPQTVLDMNKIQYNKDVGQSILESYSRVMESLAFNIIARIDDVIYVDDATKRCSAAETAPPPLFNVAGGCFGGLPIQKKISPSPFSGQDTPCTSPFATPAFCSSTPVTGSPGTELSRRKDGCLQGEPEGKPGRLLVPADVERLWASYTGNLSAAGKDSRGGAAPERD
ncbi:unnamed protein product [Spirodela intermedia]|uniref:PRONE domain-containing protein n=1 Tax=Spirodela intermedia TaxID=51605 RepID=A0A7I8K356_SPIIN|nr:unnamed protein product [Spirodela intermedia]